MNPTYNQCRRKARAKALIATHANDKGTVFVKTAKGVPKVEELLEKLEMVSKVLPS